MMYNEYGASNRSIQDPCDVQTEDLLLQSGDYTITLRFYGIMNAEHSLYLS